MAGIAVYMEAREGQVKASAFEALSEAARLKADLGGDVVACVVGHETGPVADQVKGRGADKILAIDGPSLAQVSVQGYAHALAQAVEATGATTVLLGATVQGRDLGPAVAALTKGACASECLETSVEGGALRVVRPVYAGKAWATVSATASPFVVSLRPNVFAVDAPAGGETPVETVAPTFAADDIKARVTASASATQGRKDVSEADVVVAGGRGVGSPEGFKPIEELAETLGAAVGASRAVVDLGWRPHSEQVGQTGKVISPKLYFAVGISGAIQHLAGMRTSKTIVAINKDPEAPIFKVADFGLVGDLFEVLPALTAALEEG